MGGPWESTQSGRGVLVGSVPISPIRRLRGGGEGTVCGSLFLMWVLGGTTLEKVRAGGTIGGYDRRAQPSGRSQTETIHFQTNHPSRMKHHSCLAGRPP